MHDSRVYYFTYYFTTKRNRLALKFVSLVQAAQSKGLSAAGMELSISELRSNNIVHIVIDGTAHFSVIREITETSVKLSDPKLGNIVMGREKFHEVFTGNVLVISGPQEINQTAEQTNSSTENLTTEEMESIKGQQLSVSSNMQLTAEEMQTIKGRANL
ncbi:MAG: cysteine peptidase family C39 domain-containing protein [Methanobacteriaceae archaeon]